MNLPLTVVLRHVIYFHMLKTIKIKNLAVVENLEIDFSNGLNLFTGETGTGKSIIIDALGLLVGERLDSDLLRTGADQLSVEGIFSIDSNKNVKRLLADFGFDSDINDLTLKREMKRDGRSRALVNGSFATSRFLRQIGAFLIEIHGQHQHQRLLDKTIHLHVLDDFRNLNDERESVTELYERMESIRKQLEAIRQDERLKAQKIDILEFQIKELEEANLTPGEEVKLEQEKRILGNAEFLFRNAYDAYILIGEGETNILSFLETVKKNLAKISDLNPDFQEDYESIESALYNFQDIAGKLRNFSERTAPDAGRLEDVESRLGLIKRLQQKYGATIPEMLDFLEKAKQELADLNTSGEKEAQLSADLEKIQKVYIHKALALSKKRKEAAQMLGGEVEKQLQMLAMERTQFQAKVFSLSGERGFVIDDYEYTPGPYGIDEVEFFIAPNVGEELKPLAKIASGGELSRIMLALESVFKEKPTNRTLIFDEVDSGIGGRVAEIVGKKLRMLSYNNQIICVTHLAQVAAYASTHFSISKSVRLSRTFTTVEKLASDERVREIARMLGGLNITETTLQQAREFLKKV